MEEYVVYVLFSKRYKRFYTGYTSDLRDRFRSHNELSTKGYTLRYRPWQVVYVEFFATKLEAIKRESNRVPFQTSNFDLRPSIFKANHACLRALEK